MKKELKVLVIEPSGNLWGSEKVLLDFLAIASIKAKVGVCYPRGSLITEKLLSLPVLSYPWFIANLHKKHAVYKILSLSGLFLSVLLFRPDVIYVNQAGVTRMVKWVSKLFSIPVLTHVRLVEDVEYMEDLMGKVSFSCEVICISNFIMDIFKENGIIQQNKLHMLYDVYKPRLNWKKKSSDTSILSYEVPTFICVGRIDPSKGQDILLQAMSVLKKEGQIINVVFVGEAGTYTKEYADGLVKLTDDLDMNNQVLWAGYQTDVHSIIERNIALICPSNREALGRVVFEAWDAGRVPLVWRGSGGCAEIVKASGGGVLYDEQSGESLATAIKVIMAFSPEEHHAIVTKGRDWLGTNCNPLVYADNMLELCNRLVKGK